MKKLLIILAVCGICYAVESPVRSTRVPVSSTQSGLRRSPSPVNLNGNDVITGNVSGGKEFRGFVPYGAENEIASSTATDSFNRFMRQSAPVNMGSQQSFLPQPYYVTTRTAASLRPRGTSSGLVTYSSVRKTGGTGDFEVDTVAKIKPAPISKDVSVQVQQYKYNVSRPLSYTNPEDLEKIVNRGLASQQEQEELFKALDKISVEEKAKEKSTQKKVNEEQKEKLKESENPEDAQASAAERAEPSKRTFESADPAKKGQVLKESYTQSKDKSLYELMLEQSDQKVREASAKAKEAEESQKVKEKSDEKEDSKKSELSEIDPETADSLKEIYKTFATKAKTKFNFYMRTAEEYLHKGEYYRAADAYTLASIYNPSDPLAYAGRAHALFGSGEYMSSSYYLMRAINMFPLYVKVRVDLHAMIPDKDRLENRIADVNKWIERNKSPELKFLLAYIYRQLDRQQQAVEMINAAAEELPDNHAVMALKQEIEKN
jgi:hypothetical protein